MSDDTGQVPWLHLNSVIIWPDLPHSLPALEVPSCSQGMAYAGDLQEGRLASQGLEGPSEEPVVMGSPAAPVHLYWLYWSLCFPASFCPCPRALPQWQIGSSRHGRRNSLHQIKSRRAGWLGIVGGNPAMHLNLPITGLVCPQSDFSMLWVKGLSTLSLKV